MCIITIAIESFTDIPDCIITEEIRIATFDDQHIGMLPEPILFGWPLTKAEVQKDPQLYWSFRDEIVIMNGIAIKGR